MDILLNNIPTKLPDSVMTVADLAEWKDIRRAGTAIAVNDKIVRKDMWKNAHLSSLDRVTVISAAFGG